MYTKKIKIRQNNTEIIKQNAGCRWHKAVTSKYYKKVSAPSLFVMEFYSQKSVYYSLEAVILPSNITHYIRCFCAVQVLIKFFSVEVFFW